MNHQPAPQQTQLGRRLTRSLLTAGAIALIATSCGANTSDPASAGTEPEAPATAPPASTAPGTSTPQTSTTHPPIAGAVLIEAAVDFTGEQAVGTFEVPTGTDVLGCTAGTFVDTDVSTGVRRLMTCESGERSGTITVHFVPGDDPGPGDANGPWDVEHGTDDFNGPQGEGDFSVVFDEVLPKGAETLGGEISFGPPDEAGPVTPDDTESSAVTSDGQALSAAFLDEQMDAMTVPEDIGALMIAKPKTGVLARVVLSRLPELIHPTSNWADAAL